MTAEEIEAVVNTLGDLVKVLGQADPEDKMRIYDRLGLRLDYNVGTKSVRVEVQKITGPGSEPRSGGEYVRNSSVRGGIAP
ncbi:hypothetical protein ACFQ9X_32040 [Catenulispora yoronensis]